MCLGRFVLGIGLLFGSGLFVGCLQLGGLGIVEFGVVAGDWLVWLWLSWLDYYSVFVQGCYKGHFWWLVSCDEFASLCSRRFGVLGGFGWWW